VPPALTETLEKLDQRLARIEADRQVRARESAEDLAEQLGELSEQRKEEIKGNVRWELLDQVERLRLALREHQFARERSIVRSMLVANELQFKSAELEYLCGAYLDGLDWPEAAYHRSGDDQERFLVVGKFEQLRLDIIRSMRGELLHAAPGWWSIRRPRAVAAMSVLAAGVAYMIFAAVASRFPAASTEDLSLRIAFAVGASVLVGLTCYAGLNFIAAPGRRYEYRERIRALQRDVERASWAA
jgi:hypothetical protein